MLVKSQVKYIQSLSQKKLRDQDSVFVAEGPKIINELLQSPHTRLEQLYAVEPWLRSNAGLLKNVDSGRIVAIEESELERISFLSTPNEVLAVFKKPDYGKGLELKGRLSLLLDGIQDPGNMGTIVRCADWFGIGQVICSEDCADVFGPKVVQSTMGSISRVRVHYADPVQLLEQHKDIPVYAAVLGGKEISGHPKIREGILVIGNESKGIRESILEMNVHPITIPKKGGAESLNAAVATGILLSHLA